MPVLFVAHGAPPLLDDAGWVAELAAWGQRLPRPREILMISAHWEAAPLTLGATRTAPLIYDFYGFPERYYRIKYAAPGAPRLAARVRELVGGQGQPVAEAPERGLDHGAYVPLICMYPGADVPVLQVSLPSEVPAELHALGRALAPLRDEGVLIVGSGFLTHNLRALSGRTPGWAQQFDAWCAGALARGEIEALLDYRRRAPNVDLALPTAEHFLPLLVAAGAGQGDAATFPITGFWYGSLARRSVQFG